METDALAYFDGSATLTAEIVSTELLATLGAVYKPEAVIEPNTALHVTAVFAVPDTLEANCIEPPDRTVAEAGEIVTLIPPTGAFAKTSTDAVAYFVGSAALDAEIVSTVPRVTLGAVYRPEVVIEPKTVVHLTD